MFLNKFQKLKYYILTLLIFFFSFSSYSIAKTARERLQGVGSDAGFKEVEGGGEYYFAEKIGSIIQIVLSFLGVIFVILIIYGGFMWMTAGGKEQQVESAKKIITNSVIGIAIVMLAYAITWFVLFKLGESAEFTTGLE